MRIDWKNALLRVAGAFDRCPMCGSAAFRVVERNERGFLPNLRGVPLCACRECGEVNDLVAELAKREGSSLHDALADLRAHGELEGCDRDLEAYLLGKQAQKDVESHFARCVAALRASPHLCGIRAGMSVATIRQLPPSTGINVTEDVPSALSALTVNRYVKSPLTLYRYEFDGEIACIDAQNPRTGETEHRVRLIGDVGVYLGQFAAGETPKTLLGTHNPRTAGQIYGAMRAESTLPPPVIGIAGFPLPTRFSGVERLYLMDAPDSPLPLDFAIKAWAGTVVHAAETPVRVRVLTPSCKASEVTAWDVRALAGANDRGEALRNWLSRKLIQQADCCEEVACSLLKSGVSEEVRERLAELLGDDAPKALLDTLRLPTLPQDDVVTLGSGKLLKNTPVGLYTAFREPKTKAIKTKTMLCNVGIAVDARVVGKTGEVACCTVTHPDPDVPSMPVRVPKEHWCNPDSMAEDVRKAYADTGRTPYVAFYRVGGYAWSDIMQMLGSRCPVQSGIPALGAMPSGEVHLPNAAILRQCIRPQTKTGLISPDALAAYSALPGEAATEDVEPLLSFMDGPASLLRTGVTAGLMHVLHCAAGSLFDRSGVRKPPAHLLLVETEPGVWDETLRTLAYTLSGSEYVPLMDYGDKRGFLHSWGTLGTLPLVTRLPVSDDLPTVLSTSPVSVMAVVDPVSALTCSGRGNIAFALPNVEAAGDALTQDDVDMLRKALVSLIASKAGTQWANLTIGGPVSTSTPCMTALGAVCPTTDRGTVAGSLYRVVRGNYLGAGPTGMAAFFNAMHRSCVAEANGEDPVVPVTFVAGEPEDAVRASCNDRGQHVFVSKDVVVVSKAIVQLLNRERKFVFDAEQLSREFAENGILLQDARGLKGADVRRMWAFPRDVWDARAVRAEFGPKK